MKNLLKFTFIAVMAISLSSCTQRLIDFTVISTKNANLGVKKSDGKKTKGKSMKVLFIGVNIKDAIDDALENAGSDYDLLIDGVVKSKTYPFYGGYVVEGTAISSSDMKSKLGVKGFEDWCKEHKIVTPSSPVIEDNN